jgi:hypothetical protein
MSDLQRALANAALREVEKHGGCFGDLIDPVVCKEVVHEHVDLIEQQFKLIPSQFTDDPKEQQRLRNDLLIMFRDLRAEIETLA